MDKIKQAWRQMLRRRYDVHGDNKRDHKERILSKS